MSCGSTSFFHAFLTVNLSFTLERTTPLPLLILYIQLYFCVFQNKTVDAPSSLQPDGQNLGWCRDYWWEEWQFLVEVCDEVDKKWETVPGKLVDMNEGTKPRASEKDERIYNRKGLGGVFWAGGRTREKWEQHRSIVILIREVEVGSDVVKKHCWRHSMKGGVARDNFK